jgi:hypothetical protein
MLVLLCAGAALGQELVNAPAPDGDGPFDQLSDVSRLSGTDVWVVGSTRFEDGSVEPMAGHWDGFGWEVPATPTGSLDHTYLTGLGAVSATELYAVGYTSNDSFSDSQSRTFILRYNGTSWRRMISPNTTRPDNRLYDTSIRSATDGWAVGESLELSNAKPLVLRWNGTNWRIRPAPSVGTFSRLLGVDALASNDAWAVGTKFVRGNDHGFALHWNGLAWSEVAVPDEEPYQTTLVDVDGVSSDDVWAVGYHLTVIGFTEPYQTTAMHWDGSTWEVVPTPDPSDFNCILFGVSAFATDDVWAIGWWDDGTANHALALHWDGIEWTQVPADSPYSYINELYGIEGSAEDVWAVGTGTDGLFSVEALVERGP